jgi:hypothetical protein
MAQCRQCSESFNAYRTDTAITGHGPEVEVEFKKRCRTSSFCDECLIARIKEERGEQGINVYNIKAS